MSLSTKYPSRYTVLRCAQISKNVYEDEWCECQDIFINNTETDTQLTIDIECDCIAFVAIRGTSSFKDVSTDLNVFRTEIKDDIKIHGGFYNSFLSIVDEFDRHTSSVNHIIFGAHSLGSSIGVLLAYHVAKKYPHKKVEMVGFGSPKVGNQSFVDDFSKLNIKSVFVSHYLDRVAHVPILSCSYMDNNIRFWKWNPFSKSQHSIDNYLQTVKDKYFAERF